jgi:hypothetical protein
MLFGPDGLPLGLGKSDDIDRGLVSLREQVALGITTFYLARGVDGFALLVGSPKRFPLGAGVVIGVSLTAINLAAMRNRIFELLGAEVEASRLSPRADALSGAQADDVDAGFRFLGEQIGKGCGSFFLGRGPQGYALLVGSSKCFDVGAGVGIGLPLPELGLRLLRDRVVELLHGQDVARRLKRSGN